MVCSGLKNSEDGETIRCISVAKARVLRDQVLRPGLPAGRSIYRGDDAPDTLHLGAFVKGRLGAVATVCRESMPGSSDANEWRLRGMATLEQLRGRGLGRLLAMRCVAHAADRQGTLLWCSARIATVPFYRSLGFKEQGEGFHLPEFSGEVYILMRAQLTRQSESVSAC
jgi:ribosomal protein S18 acetylase RimI-like enzyme